MFAWLEEHCRKSAVSVIIQRSTKGGQGERGMGGKGRKGGKETKRKKRERKEKGRIHIFVDSATAGGPTEIRRRHQIASFVVCSHTPGTHKYFLSIIPFSVSKKGEKEGGEGEQERRRGKRIRTGGAIQIAKE